MQSIEKLEDLQDIRAFAATIQQRLSDLGERAGEGSVKETKVLRLPEAELAESNRRIAEMTAEREKVTRNKATLETSIHETETEITESRTAGRREREVFFEKERLLREKEAELGQKKDRLSEIRVALARVEVREEDLQKLIREELGLKPDELRASSEHVDIHTQEKSRARNPPTEGRGRACGVVSIRSSFPNTRKPKSVFPF